MSGFFRSTVQADSTAAAELRLRELYGDVSLAGLGGYHEHAVGDEKFSFAEVELDGNFQVNAEVDSVTFAFSTPGYRWRVGREEGDLSVQPAVFQPRQPMSSLISARTRVSTVNFDRTALQELATALYAQPTTIWFDGQSAASGVFGSAWKELMPLIRDGAMMDNELARAGAFHSLAVMALESFRLAGDRRERTLTAAAGLHAYRRATGFIDDHLSLPITLADVAAAAGVGEAELELVFRAHSRFGWTPAEQLRRARLAAAHHDLVNGDPTRGDTVQSIAARYGFTHPGRFAARYRNVYGTTPRYVLDR